MTAEHLTNQLNSMVETQIVQPRHLRGESLGGGRRLRLSEEILEESKNEGDSRQDNIVFVNQATQDQQNTQLLREEV